MYSAVTGMLFRWCMALTQEPRDKPLHYIRPVVSERHATCETTLSGGACNLRVNRLVVYTLDSLYIRRVKSLVFFDSEWCFPSWFSDAAHSAWCKSCNPLIAMAFVWHCLLNCVIQFGVYVNEIHSHVQFQHYLSPPNGRLPGVCVEYKMHLNSCLNHRWVW